MSEKSLPLNCFGSLEYFVNVIRKDEIVFNSGEKWDKQRRRNRYSIPGPNKVQTLSIPLQKPFKGIALSEIKISNAENWQKLHWHTLLTAYGKSPFFEYYDYKLEKLYQKPYESLFDFNRDAMAFCLQALKSDKEASYASTEGLIELHTGIELKPYLQVFSEKFGFEKEVSVLDVIFNLGPDAGTYLEEAATAFSS